MTSNSLRSLVALNFLSLVLAAIILVAGKAALSIGPPNHGRSASDFEQILATKIGTPYTEKMHTTVSGLLHRDEDVATSYWKVIKSHGQVGFEVGILAGIGSLSSLVIAVRASRKPMKPADEAAPSDGEKPPN